MPNDEQTSNLSSQVTMGVQRRTLRERVGIRAQHDEGEGFGRTDSLRGDMHDLGFDVVKHSRFDAALIALRIHNEPPGDETIALFTDASLPGAVGARTRAGVAVARVMPKGAGAAQSVTVGVYGETVLKAHRMDVVEARPFTAADRASTCPTQSPQLESEEGELVAILKAFKYAVFEVDLRDIEDLATRRLLLWSDCMEALDKVRLYKAGDSAWERHRFAWILREILECARKLKEHGVYVKCHWVPAHMRIPGNECADYFARRMAHGLPLNPEHAAWF